MTLIFKFKLPAVFCKMASVPVRMKALVKEQEGSSYTYKEVPVSQPQQDELLVKVSKVALCGTDISKYKWNSGRQLAIELAAQLTVSLSR